MDSVSTAETWLQKHERLIIVFALLIAVLCATHWVLDYKAQSADQRLSEATQQLSDQKAKDAQIANQVAQLTSGYNTIVTQLSAQNAELAAAQSNRVIVLQGQQAADKTLPLPELGSRWAGLVGFSPSEITPSTNGLTVSDTAARDTVSDLEQVPVLTQNLKDETTVANNNQEQVTRANGLIDGLNKQVDGMKLTITDDEKACTAKVNDVKAQANKSKMKWFKVGFVTGFISGLYTGLHI